MVGANRSGSRPRGISQTSKHLLAMKHFGEIFKGLRCALCSPSDHHLILSLAWFIQ